LEQDRSSLDAWKTAQQEARVTLSVSLLTFEAH
jgi:hypothetical protein